jgi:hypothetical protein
MAPHCIGSAWAHGKAPLPAAAAEMADQFRYRSAYWERTFPEW